MTFCSLGYNSMATDIKKLEDRLKALLVVVVLVAIFVAAAVIGTRTYVPQEELMEWFEIRSSADDNNKNSVLTNERAMRIAEEIAGGKAKHAAFMHKGSRAVFEVTLMKNRRMSKIMLDAKTGRRL